MELTGQSIQLKTGFGNYDAFNIGLKHNYNKWHMEYGVGSDFNIYDQGYYNAIHLSFGKQIIKSLESKNGKLNLNFKCFVWNLENQQNVFSAVTLGPELLYLFKKIKRCNFGLFGGLVWTSVFRYHRKTYTDVGFPKEFQANLGFQFYFSRK